MTRDFVNLSRSGFEMETFEFLNMLQTHGFPKVMGIVTNLDSFKQRKGLNNMKRQLKHRFWTEIYQGVQGTILFTVVVLTSTSKKLRNHSNWKTRGVGWPLCHPPHSQFPAFLFPLKAPKCSSSPEWSTGSI